jgi:hypothetical protein
MEVSARSAFPNGDRQESSPSLSALSVSPSSLTAAFATVIDPRRAASVIYPLPAMLALAVAAMLANHRSVLAIAEWGTRQPADGLAGLGFPPGRTPSTAATSSRSASMPV